MSELGGAFCSWVYTVSVPFSTTADQGEKDFTKHQRPRDSTLIMEFVYFVVFMNILLRAN